MASKNRKSGLGKGLSSLFEDNNTISEEPVATLRLSEIEPNREQPRKDFDENALAELADSIRQHGVIQPLMVRPMPDGTYQLVAGERRWRASRMAGLTEVPVVIRELSDEQTMELALIENLQREDLNPIEEALGYRALMDNFDMTQEKVAASVGKSRPVIANSLRLLKLPQSVVNMVRSSQISSGHARALLALDDEEEIVKLADKIVSDSLTVRDIEKIAQQKGKTDAANAEKPFVRDTFFDEVQLALEEHLQRKIKISHRGSKGSVTIEFLSKDELTELANKLCEE